LRRGHHRPINPLTPYANPGGKRGDLGKSTTALPKILLIKEEAENYCGNVGEKMRKPGASFFLKRGNKVSGETKDQGPAKGGVYSIRKNSNYGKKKEEGT